MKLKMYSLFVAGLICTIGFILFENSYNVCLSNSTFCSDFFIDFLYPTMFLLGLSSFFSFLILFFLKLGFQNFLKKIIYISSFFIVISLLIPAQCSAPLGLCIYRKIFIASYSSLIFIVVLIVSIVQFVKDKHSTLVK